MLEGAVIRVNTVFSSTRMKMTNGFIESKIKEFLNYFKNTEAKVSEIFTLNKTVLSH